MAQWWIQSGKKETEGEKGKWEIQEKDFKSGGQVRNSMSAEQEDKVNESQEEKLQIWRYKQHT